MSPPDLHILPIADLREHRESRDCWCDPALEQEQDTVLVIHQSADGRELVEQHGLQ
jgi:hypothetical protein